MSHSFVLMFTQRAVSLHCLFIALTWQYKHVFYSTIGVTNCMWVIAHLNKQKYNHYYDSADVCLTSHFDWSLQSESDHRPHNLYICFQSRNGAQPATQG